MESFEDLGLSPELVAALASEGAEEPTPFQVAAIPVVRRGNNLLGKAGPGAGTLTQAQRLEPMAGESLHWLGVWRLKAGDGQAAQ